MSLVGGNCLLYPRKLEFHSIELPETQTETYNEIHEVKNVTDDAQANATVPDAEKEKVKRETSDNETDVTEAPFDGEAFFTGEFSPIFTPNSK